MSSTNQTGRGRTALVTGASSGIGLEFARVFAHNGYNLVLVARSEQKLDELKREIEKNAGVSVKVIIKDLAREEAPQEIYSELEREGVRVDALVNSAGYALYGKFTETDAEDELNMMKVNMLALTKMTKLFLPGMVERGHGRLLNLASMAAFQPGPLMSVYYATKAYVLFFSEGIANELKGTGVTVTALCPGPSSSGFQKRAAMEQSRLVQSGLMDVRTVARLGYRGLMQGKTVVVPGRRNALFTLFPRLVPRDLAAAIIRQAQERV
jgi:short-subunit dehydrogenase